MRIFNRRRNFQMLPTLQFIVLNGRLTYRIFYQNVEVTMSSCLSIIK